MIFPALGGLIAPWLWLNRDKEVIFFPPMIQISPSDIGFYKLLIWKNNYSLSVLYFNPEENIFLIEPWSWEALWMLHWTSVVTRASTSWVFSFF